MQTIRRFDHGSRGVRVLAVAALAISLAGCFLPRPREAEAEATAQAALSQCDQSFRSGKYKTHLAAVDCAIPKVVNAYEGAAYPFMDLVYVALQARRIGAAKVDAGDVTEADYQRDLKALETRLAAEDDRRREITKYGGRPQPTPVDTLIEGLNAFAPTPTASELPSTPLGAQACLSLGGIRPCKQ